MAEAIPIAMAVFSVGGKLFEGKQARDDSKERESTARLNRQYATINSVEELRVASREEQRVRREGNKQLAEQFAAFAQSGAGHRDFGTARAFEESASLAEMDALNVRYKGQIASRDQAVAASQYGREAQAEKGTRRGVAIKTAVGVGTSLLSGYGRVQGQKI